MPSRHFCVYLFSIIPIIEIYIYVYNIIIIAHIDQNCKTSTHYSVRVSTINVQTGNLLVVLVAIVILFKSKYMKISNGPHITTSKSLRRSIITNKHWSSLYTTLTCVIQIAHTRSNVDRGRSLIRQLNVDLSYRLSCVVFRNLISETIMLLINKHKALINKH